MTLNVLRGTAIGLDEAGLSEAAWALLRPNEGDIARMAHPQPLLSFRHVRSKVFGGRWEAGQIESIVQDIAAHRYMDVHLASFITACGTGRLDLAEITALTRAMVNVGQRLHWGRQVVADKHSVGGLPGNRTTPIVVAIAAAAGLCIPKTSSRAITSPAGTADAMETIAPVDLSIEEMRRVVDLEGGCIVWGGAVGLSPADDILVRVERVLDVDTEGQMVASILSKKLAAGATHLVIDLPVGPTAKVRSSHAAERLEDLLSAVSRETGLETRIVFTDGSQPVGRGIGPALEARDVLAVLRNDPSGPADLANRAVTLAGALLEALGRADPGTGAAAAREHLASGRAWSKFQRICEAQGGMRVPPVAPHRHDIAASAAGTVAQIDNRRLAQAAKLAGAPKAPAAGLFLQAKAGAHVERGQPLFTVHAQTPGELAYAVEYIQNERDIVRTEQP
jgi:thymidine phosphorylase